MRLKLVVKADKPHKNQQFEFLYEHYMLGVLEVLKEKQGEKRPTGLKDLPKMTRRNDQH